jgi:chromosome partitioning protein
MKVIVTANEKGGVGKTTGAVTVGAGLAARGRRVLLVDSDAQGHATRSVGIGKYPGFYDLLVRDANWQDVLKPVLPNFWGAQPTQTDDGANAYPADEYRLWLLGSNVETANVANSISDVWKLFDRLQELADRFDYVVIDTAPTPSLLHGAIYLASDYLIYPTQAELLGLDGLVSSMAHHKNFSTMRPMQVGGIVPMMVRPQTWEHTQMLRSLRKQYGDLVWPEITESIVWAEASRAARAVFAYRPDHQAAEQAWELVNRVEALAS